MFDLNPDVQPTLADPSIHPALRDDPRLPSPAALDGAGPDAVVRLRASIGRRLIAAGAALLPDEPVRRPVARS